MRGLRVSLFALRFGSSIQLRDAETAMTLGHTSPTKFGKKRGGGGYGLQLNHQDGELFRGLWKRHGENSIPSDFNEHSYTCKDKPKEGRNEASEQTKSHVYDSFDILPYRTHCHDSSDLKPTYLNFCSTVSPIHHRVSRPFRRRGVLLAHIKRIEFDKLSPLGFPTCKSLLNVMIGYPCLSSQSADNDSMLYPGGIAK